MEIGLGKDHESSDALLLRRTSYCRGSPLSPSLPPSLPVVGVTSFHLTVAGGAITFGRRPAGVERYLVRLKNL